MFARRECATSRYADAINDHGADAAFAPLCRVHLFDAMRRYLPPNSERTTLRCVRCHYAAFAATPVWRAPPRYTLADADDYHVHMPPPLYRLMLSLRRFFA